MNQNHEQSAADIKGVGRANTLKRSDTTLKRWRITGLDIARLLEEFESFSIFDEESVLEHHDRSLSVAKKL